MLNFTRPGITLGLLGWTLPAGGGGTVSPEVLSYVSAATVGGGVVFAVALVLPTVVYLRGVCEIYLTLRPGLDEGDGIDHR